MPYCFESAVEGILRKHPEYTTEAYTFIREALDASVERFCKQGAPRHLSAAELYSGACAYALEEYGPLAALVLEHWGIRGPKDVGAVVYNLIEAGVFGRSKDDTQEQFDSLPPLQDLLDTPFQARN